MKSKELHEHLQRLEVLSSMYNDICEHTYSSLEQKNTAALKLKLLKKEMLMINHHIDRMIYATT